MATIGVVIRAVSDVRKELTRPAAPDFALSLTTRDRRLLEGWVRSGLTPQRVARRARIILLCAEGLPDREVSRRLDVHRHTVALWRSRVLEEGVETLTRDRPGRGRKAGRVAS